MAIGKAFARDYSDQVSVVLGIDLVNRRLYLGTRVVDMTTGKLRTKIVSANGYQIAYGTIRDDGSGRCCDDDPTWYDPWDIDDTTWEAFHDYYRTARRGRGQLRRSKQTEL
jgi:hypothetical protein